MDIVARLEAARNQTLKYFDLTGEQLERSYEGSQGFGRGFLGESQAKGRGYGHCEVPRLGDFNEYRAVGKARFQRRCAGEGKGRLADPAGPDDRQKARLG